MNRSDWYRIGLLVVLLGVVGCASPTSSAPSSKDAEAGEQTLLIVSIQGGGSGGSRTIAPPLGLGLIASYTVVFEKGSAQTSVTGTTSPIRVPGLSPGAWMLTVSGLDASGKVIAQGSPAGPVVVTPNQTATASVNLAFLQSGGTGGLNLTVTFPHTVGIDSVDATLAGTAVASNLTTDGTTDTVVLSTSEVPSGSPLLRVFLKKEGVVLAGLTESVWIFRNIITTATLALAASDFGSAPSSPSGLSVTAQPDGSVLLTWTSTSNVADAYLVRRGPTAAGPFTPIGSDLPFDAASTIDSGLTSDTVYHYQVIAKNRFGESPPASGVVTTFTPVDSPIFSLPANTVQPETQFLTLSSATSDTTIYYTTNGTVPTRSSLVYSAPLALSSFGTAVTLTAVATKAGMADSAPSTASYTMNKRPVIASFVRSGTGTILRASTTGAAATSVTLLTTANDPEGNPITYTYGFSTTNTLGTFTGTGTVVSNTVTATGGTAVVTFTKPGTTTVQVTATDSIGNVSTASLVVTVTNRAPTLTVVQSTNPVYNNGTDTKTLTVTASDLDVGDNANLVYTYQVTSGTGSIFGNGPSALFVAGTQGGINTVSVRVDDRTGVTNSIGVRSVQVVTSGWGQVLPTAEPLVHRFGLAATLFSGGSFFMMSGQTPATGTVNSDVF